MFRPTCNYMMMRRSGASLMVLRVVSWEYNLKSDSDLINIALCLGERENAGDGEITI